MVEEKNHRCQTIAPVVLWDDAHHLKCNDIKVIVEWDSGHWVNC
jgi:hypothetical protein